MNHTNINKETEENTNFRKVLWTGKFSQTVLMSLGPGEDIGLEVHKKTDQFIRIEKGHGIVILDGHKLELKPGDAISINAGQKHNILNVNLNGKPYKNSLKLYTVYSGVILHKPDEIERIKVI